MIGWKRPVQHTRQADSVFLIDNNKHPRKQKDRKDPQLIIQVRKKYNKIEATQTLGPYPMSNAPPKWTVMPQSRTSKEILHTVIKNYLIL